MMLEVTQARALQTSTANSQGATNISADCSISSTSRLGGGG